VPRAGLTRERVGAAAAALADAIGAERLTMAALAKELGVSGPALYKHVASLEDVQRDVALHGLRALTARLARAAAGRAGRDALGALADAYRAFAREHPGQALAAARAPEPEDADHVAASDEALEVLAAVLRGYELRPADLVDAMRIVRASLHGWVVLELGGGFGRPEDVGATFRRHVDGLHAALTALGGRAGARPPAGGR
jgi:AcrR family transcriptional regulator